MLVFAGGAGLVVSRFVGSNKLPTGAENVGSIFATALSTAEASAPVVRGGRGGGRGGRRDREGGGEYR